MQLLWPSRNAVQRLFELPADTRNPIDSLREKKFADSCNCKQFRESGISITFLNFSSKKFEKAIPATDIEPAQIIFSLRQRTLLSICHLLEKNSKFQQIKFIQFRLLKHSGNAIDKSYGHQLSKCLGFASNQRPPLFEICSCYKRKITKLTVLKKDDP